MQTSRGDRSHLPPSHPLCTMYDTDFPRAISPPPSPTTYLAHSPNTQSPSHPSAYPSASYSSVHLHIYVSDWGLLSLSTLLFRFIRGRDCFSFTRGSINLCSSNALCKFYLLAMWGYQVPTPLDFTNVIGTSVSGWRRCTNEREV